MPADGSNGGDEIDPYETEPVKSVSTQDWIAELKVVSAQELRERIKAMEDTFGISAQTAAIIAATNRNGSNGDGSHEDEEQSAFDVVLTEAGDRKVPVIKVVRGATGLGLKESKALVDNAPHPVKQGVDRNEAEKLKAELEEAGARVEIR